MKAPLRNSFNASNQEIITARQLVLFLYSLMGAEAPAPALAVVLVQVLALLLVRVLLLVH